MTTADAAAARTSLPPGQRALPDFPRFGTHLGRRPPAVPERPVLRVRFAGDEVAELTVTDLAGCSRTEVTADLHCVSGWSATGLRWAGVRFADLYAELLAPLLPAGVSVTHVVATGLDGHEACLLLEDALADDVLVADGLDGEPLGPDHGAPLRLVSPQQYGYVSCKHLCRLELLASPPRRELGAAHPWAQRMLRGPLVLRHPRARVWAEERHPYLPARPLRPLYRWIYRRAFRMFPSDGDGRSA